MTSRVVVLGGCGAWPEPGRACSGFVLPAAPQQAGPLRLESMLLPHYVPNAGVQLSAPGLKLAYTGDTGPDPALAELGREADLFITDATDRAQRTGGPRSPPAAHPFLAGQ